MTMTPKTMITVTMQISPDFKPVSNKWYVKMERDVMIFIEVPIFQFSSESMNIAVTKVADLVARHAENYFNSIEIK
jgi:hypothetical protein